MASEIKRETVVSIKDAYLRYASEKGSVTALENVNLEIEKGEFICVLGPSGCGKSTLLKIIAGFHQPTEGTAMMGDTPITGPSADRGVVFQTPTLYPWLNIYQNVEYGPKMRKVPKDEREAGVKKYLELVGLKDFAKQKPYELSGGMKQRASLARVLVNQPKMILMDEPFGALDALTRQNMQTLIREIWNKTGNTEAGRRCGTAAAKKSAGTGNKSNRHVFKTGTDCQRISYGFYLRHCRYKSGKCKIYTGIYAYP